MAGRNQGGSGQKRTGPTLCQDGAAPTEKSCRWRGFVLYSNGQQMCLSEDRIDPQTSRTPCIKHNGNCSNKEKSAPGWIFQEWNGILLLAECRRGPRNCVWSNEYVRNRLEKTTCMPCAGRRGSTRGVRISSLDWQGQIEQPFGRWRLQTVDLHLPSDQDKSNSNFCVSVCVRHRVL